jgi:signal transduction histidine kinase
VVDDFTRLLRGRINLIKEIPVKRKDGAVFYADVTGAFIVLAGKLYLLASFRDITERKEAERLKDEILSIASHELRTPLAAIKQAIHLVYSETAGPASDAQKRFLDIGRRNVDRLAHLIDELLNLSKMEAQKLKLEKRLGDINQLVSDAVSAYRSLAEEKKLTLEEKLDPQLPEIYFDSAHLYQVLANLLSNALKFSEEEGRILVSTSFYGLGKDYLQVSIEDTGVGIAKEDFEKLFKKFQQLDMAITRKIGGTGLGLAICKQIVDLHGGRIWAESEGRGKGSKFIFILPIQLSTEEKTIPAGGESHG